MVSESHRRDAKILRVSLNERVGHFNPCVNYNRYDLTSTEYSDSKWKSIRRETTNASVRFHCQQKQQSLWFRCGALIRESYTWQSRQRLLKKTRQSKPHIRMWPICYGYEPPSHSVQIILNGMTVTMQTQLSIAILSWGLNIEWMIISFSLLSLSLTCRNGQFMQAAPWPGKVDAPHRRKAAMFQTMEMNSGTTQGWFRSWATWN